MFHAHSTLLLKTLTHSPQMKSAVSSAIFVIFFSILTGCSLIEKSSNERSPTATETKIRDVVYLKDGSVLRGTLRETDDTSKVKIVLADGSEFVRPKIEVERISTDTLVVTRYEPQKVKEKTYWNRGMAMLEQATPNRFIRGKQSVNLTISFGRKIRVDLESDLIISAFTFPFKTSAPSLAELSIQPRTVMG